jgi:hypothetical protein
MESGWVDSVEDGIVWGRTVRDGHEWEFWCPLRLLTDAARVDIQPGVYVTIRNGELAVNNAIWTTHDMETADREARELHRALAFTSRDRV